MTTQTSMRKTAGAGDRSDATRAAVKKYYIYVVLLVIVVLFSLVKVGEVGLFGRGAFLSRDSVINMLRVSAPILILSGAFTLLMISGYIDLSVGSAMSLAAVVFAVMILNGFAFLPAFALTLVVGIGMGALNGFNVMKLRITPVIATLVTLNLFKGIALLIVPDGTSAIKSTATQKMPAMINYFARQRCLPRAAHGLLRRHRRHHRAASSCSARRSSASTPRRSAATGPRRSSPASARSSGFGFCT